MGQIGSQVVVPYRGDGMEVRDLKLMGDLGQIVPLPYQIRDKRSVERVLKDSNVVINAISRRRESGNFSFHDTHVNATHMIARVKFVCVFCFCFGCFANYFLENKFICLYVCVCTRVYWEFWDLFFVFCL